MNHLTLAQYRARRQRTILLHLATEALVETLGLLAFFLALILGMYALDRAINPQPPADAPTSPIASTLGHDFGHDLTRRHAR